MKIISGICSAVVLGVALAPIPAGAWVRLLLPLLLAGAALFTIRGYGITPNALLIQRLFWTTRLGLSDLQSARLDPQAVRWSIRTCGNGGLFSFTGWYWNRTLGPYRAFVTDPKRLVVLKFARRTVVVSPDSPEGFVRELSSHSAAHAH